ncbi:MAG TPA: VOC family protein [Caulobacteraceae bacterium]|jgi:uncharacterized glyoxalase superfamily protein PhnB
MSSVFTPQIFYRDPRAAIAWLERAFGFETTLLVTDDAGAVAHAEMGLGLGRFNIGAELASNDILGPARMKSPASLDGQGTQFVRVALESGLDAHCATAEAAGARITQRPETQFYGSRVYRALDSEGHVWTFDQPVSEVPLAAMESASGLKITRPA